jgi:hypothetical protein
MFRGHIYRCRSSGIHVLFYVYRNKSADIARTLGNIYMVVKFRRIAVKQPSLIALPFHRSEAN